MQSYINTLPNLEKVHPSEIVPFECGARVYSEKKEKVIEGIITKVTSLGAYIWQAKEKYPQETAEWFPFYTKYFWSVFKLK